MTIFIVVICMNLQIESGVIIWNVIIKITRYIVNLIK